MRDAGIESPEDCDAYGALFAKHRITSDVLCDLSRESLHAMGITVEGHVLKILRHCRLVAAQARPPGYITVCYRGSFAFGRDGLADVKFRKLTKILVSGKVLLCREVFGDSLNESRDPDHGGASDDRYTARFFLKHLMIEQAFDDLQNAGFRCVGTCGAATSTSGANEPAKPGVDPEELRWNHSSEFVFCRP